MRNQINFLHDSSKCGDLSFFFFFFVKIRAKHLVIRQPFSSTLYSNNLETRNYKQPSKLIFRWHILGNQQNTKLGCRSHNSMHLNFSHQHFAISHCDQYIYCYFRRGFFRLSQADPPKNLK